ncbi:hypothetical protein [Prosthecomicrobium sp. N25]|uniref:hypothetical protein n=1 Tax=Prosthecomicrobium sp. N25 TaxID=3129254 RepID=UPI0030787CD9
MSGLIYLSAILVVIYGVATAAGKSLPPEVEPFLAGGIIVVGGLVLAVFGLMADRLQALVDRVGALAEAAKSDGEALRTLSETRLGEIARHLGQLEKRSETYEAVARRVADAIEAEQKNGEIAYGAVIDAAVAIATDGKQDADRKMLYRGREVTMHADGSVTAQTALGLRRFASLTALDDYILA